MILPDCNYQIEVPAAFHNMPLFWNGSNCVNHRAGKKHYRYWGHLHGARVRALRPYKGDENVWAVRCLKHNFEFRIHFYYLAEININGQHPCTCPMQRLMVRGCGCGGI